MAKVLVIEDSEIMNEMLVEMLSNVGHQVTGVLDGAEGLALLESDNFDLLVTDIVVPEKDGIEIIYFTKNRDKRLPVIALSGGGRTGPGDYLSLAEKFGADYTFQKPIDKETFLGAVRECLVNDVG